MMIISGEHNSGPIQRELAAWPVCSRASVFLPARIVLKASAAEAIQYYGGPERKEFELKPNFDLTQFSRTPRLPRFISASLEKPLIFISSGSDQQPLRAD